MTQRRHEGQDSSTQDFHNFLGVQRAKKGKPTGAWKHDVTLYSFQVYTETGFHLPLPLFSIVLDRGEAGEGGESEPVVLS